MDIVIIAEIWIMKVKGYQKITVDMSEKGGVRSVFPRKFKQRRKNDYEYKI